MVLVDSSVWIAASVAANPECLKLKRLVESNEVVVTKLIQVEVCQGARSERQFVELWQAFEGFRFLEITDHHWQLSAKNYFRCRKKGITLSTVDCIIATLSCFFGVELWTLDKTLKSSHRVLGFDVWKS